MICCRPFPNIISSPSGGVSFLPESLDYFARVETAGDELTEPQKIAVNQFIAALQTASVWSKLDEVYIFGGSLLAGQKVKLKFAAGNDEELTTFNMSDSDASVSLGFGPGSTNSNKYATTGYIPADHSRTYTDFSFGCSFLGEPGGGSGNGHFLTDTPITSLFTFNIGLYGGLFPGISGSSSPAQVNGFHCFSLGASGQRRTMDDMVMDLSTQAQTPTFATQVSLFRSAFNSVTDFATGRMGVATLGGALTATEQKALGSAVRDLEFAWGRRTAPGGKVAFLSDSIGQGFNASPNYTARYSALVAASFGMLEINYGVQGGRLTGALASAGVNRYADILGCDPSKIILQLGTNDAGEIYTIAFRAAYDTILTGLINSGFSAGNITVCSLPFCTDTISRPEINQQLYADAAEDAASEFGTVFADIFGVTLANPSAISGDTIHPTTGGHDLIADTIIAVN